MHLLLPNVLNCSTYQFIVPVFVSMVVVVGMVGFLVVVIVIVIVIVIVVVVVVVFALCSNTNKWFLLPL